MNVRRINLMLWTACAVFVAGAAVMVVYALLPVEIAVDVAPDRTRAAATTRSSTNTVDLAALEAIGKLPLRTGGNAEVAVTPKGTDANPQPTSTNGQLTLVGTIGSSLAMIRTPDGAVEVRGVGESAGGAKITAIRPSQVDIEQGGQKFTLTRPKDPGGG
jgi:hypothetical protein